MSEARSRPFVAYAEVHLDWLDGHVLYVHLTPDGTAADAEELWCEVLYDAEGGAIRVSDDYERAFAAPRRRECTELAPTP